MQYSNCVTGSLFASASALILISARPFHCLFKISGPSPKYINNNVELFHLISGILLFQLPSWRAVLGCLFCVLDCSVVHPWAIGQSIVITAIIVVVVVVVVVIIIIIIIIIINIITKTCADVFTETRSTKGRLHVLCHSERLPRIQVRHVVPTFTATDCFASPENCIYSKNLSDL